MWRVSTPGSISICPVYLDANAHYGFPSVDPLCHNTGLNVERISCVIQVDWVTSMRLIFCSRQPSCRLSRSPIGSRCQVSLLEPLCSECQTHRVNLVSAVGSFKCSAAIEPFRTINRGKIKRQRRFFSLCAMEPDGFWWSLSNTFQL